MAGSISKNRINIHFRGSVPTTNMVGPAIPAGPITSPKPSIMDEMKDGARQVGSEAEDTVEMLLAEN